MQATWDCKDSMLAEECYIVTARVGELPFEQIEGRLRSMPEVRVVPTRAPGTFSLAGTSERADIIMEMILEDDSQLPRCGVYIYLEPPDRLELVVGAANPGDRRALVPFLEWLNERCPIVLHDERGDYVHEIDERGFSAFLKGSK